MFERCNKRFTSGDSVSVLVELCHVVLCGSPAHRDSLKATVFMVRSRPALTYTCFATGLTATCALPCAPAPYSFHREIFVKSASKRAFKKQNTACSCGCLENTRSKGRDGASAGFISEMSSIPPSCQCHSPLTSKTRVENTTSLNTKNSSFSEK